MLTVWKPQRVRFQRDTIHLQVVGDLHQPIDGRGSGSGRIIFDKTHGDATIALGKHAANLKKVFDIPARDVCGVDIRLIWN